MFQAWPDDLDETGAEFDANRVLNRCCWELHSEIRSYCVVRRVGRAVVADDGVVRQ